MSWQVEKGLDGEVQVREKLRQMLGSSISGYFRTGNLICAGRQVQIDFLILIPQVGILVLEVKNWKGTIRATSDDKWEREVPNYINKFPNASLQALRASGIILQLLEQERINKWPIRSLVVFVNEGAEIIIPQGFLAPQTDIVKLSGLSEWVVLNKALGWSVNDFSRDDFEKIKAVIVKYSEPYEAVKIIPGDGEFVL